MATTTTHLPPSTQAVLTYVSDNLDQYGYCKKTNHQIAEALGIAAITVKKGLQRLVDAKTLYSFPDGRGRKLSIVSHPSLDLDGLALRLVRLMRRYRCGKSEPFFWSREKVAASLRVGKNAVVGVYDAAKANGWIVSKTINVTYKGVERTRIGWMVTPKGEQEALGTTNEKPAHSPIAEEMDALRAEQAHLLAKVERLSLAVSSSTSKATSYDPSDAEIDALLAQTAHLDSSYVPPRPAPTILDSAKEVARELAEVAAESMPEQGSKLRVILIEWDAKWNTKERLEAAEALAAEEEGAKLAALDDDDDIFYDDDPDGRWNQ